MARVLNQPDTPLQGVGNRLLRSRNLLHRRGGPGDLTRQIRPCYGEVRGQVACDDFIGKRREVSGRIVVVGDEQRAALPIRRPNCFVIVQNLVHDDVGIGQ